MKKEKRSSARYFKRAFAYIVDLIVIGMIIEWPFMKVFNDYEVGTMFTGNMILSLFLIGLLTLLYFSMFEYYEKRTIGGMLFGLQVISLKKEMDFFQVIIRNLTKISFLFLLLDCLYLFKNNEQRYFEKISSTKVVE